MIHLQILIYGDDEMTLRKITGDMIQKIIKQQMQKIDSDHVQTDGMCLVPENEVSFWSTM